MSAPTHESVTLTDGVARIIISDPKRGSSLNGEAIAAAKALLRDESGIRAIVLSGADGAHFCSGGDVKAFAAADPRGAYVRVLADNLHEFILELAQSPAPVICAVRGWAAGAGMSLACAADIAIGGPSTKLRSAYPAIGYSPDGGMSWTLPRLVGSGRAADIILTNRVVDAAEAERIGILARLVESDDDVIPAALQLATELAQGADGSYAAMKRLLAASIHATLAEQLEAEAVSITARSETAQGIEGVNAFVERRAPRFQA